MKSFEIGASLTIKEDGNIMNYKLEKFWNNGGTDLEEDEVYMNYKLEKFWNKGTVIIKGVPNTWTINLKSFEMK